MKPSYERHFWPLMNSTAVIAGVLYASWPLGYVLNPEASRRGLASALEAVNQPYNWVFTTGDGLSSLLIIVMAWLLWRRLRPSRHPRLLAASLFNIAIFGLATIIDTWLPERCLPGLPGCANWRQDHLLLAHGIFSIIGAFCLFLALALLWWRHRSNRLLSVLMAGYLLFGAFSIIEALTPGKGNWSQHYYITLCGVWLALTAYAFRRTFDGLSNTPEDHP